jgi:Uma2 family endonuclease
MVAVRKPYLTPQEYLEQERKAETKSEYHDGVIVAMSGASRQHDRVSGNIYAGLHGQLAGTPCEPFTLADVYARVEFPSAPTTEARG